MHLRTCSPCTPGVFQGIRVPGHQSCWYHPLVLRTRSAFTCECICPDRCSEAVWAPSRRGPFLSITGRLWLPASSAASSLRPDNGCACLWAVVHAQSFLHRIINGGMRSKRNHAHFGGRTEFEVFLGTRGLRQEACASSLGRGSARRSGCHSSLCLANCATLSKFLPLSGSQMLA